MELVFNLFFLKFYFSRVLCAYGPPMTIEAVSHVLWRAGVAYGDWPNILREVLWFLSGL